MRTQILAGLSFALATLLTAVTIAPPLEAQVALDEENRVDLVLDDGTTVVLMGAAKGMNDRSRKVEYHYLPTGLRLSKTPDGRPQFLFLNYTTDDESAQGGVLHFLMEWGLTADQLEEARQKLKKVCKQGVWRRRLDAAALKKSLDPKLAESRASVAEKLGPSQQRSRGFAMFGLWPVMGDIPCGEIRGAARVTTDANAETFRVISATLSSDAMTRTLISSGRAPILPGNRIAVAADLTALGAELLAEPFERDMPIADLSLELDLAFTSRVPAGEGRIVLHWDRLLEQGEELEREWNKKQQTTVTGYRKKCWIGKRVFNPKACDVVEYQDKVKTVSDVELREFYSLLEEQEIIELDFRENVEDERLTPVREAFFQYFLDSFTEPISAEDMAMLRNEDDSMTDELEINQKKKRYYRSKTSRSISQGMKTQEFKLTYHLAYKRPFSIVQNIKSWYDDVQANYPDAMTDVILNDPFFNNTPITFHLDSVFPALFSFESDRSAAINYVTVQMRKRRDGPGENDFFDSVTIDESYIAENSLKAQMMFAGGGTDDRSYEYMVQWSYGGGHLYPETPRWIRAETAAVTLVPPVKLWDIEVEGDLAEMEASEIPRITAQVLYSKFGNTVVESIPISPAKGEPVVSRTVLIDEDQNGVVYRLIVYRKTGDVIATEWSPLLAHFVYAAVPSELLQDPSLLEQAKDAAKDVGGQALEAAKDEVMDRFREALGGK